jgi:hypothetical protein
MRMKAEQGVRGGDTAPFASSLQKDLREHIDAVTSGLCTRPQLDRFVLACHALALAFLKRKRSTGLLAEAQGLNLSDAAIDCIGDLFQRSETGEFVRVRAYFGSMDVAGMSDEELLTYLRKLVFSQVNQGVFRLYHEVDPSLGKILRNVKLAVNAVRNFETADRFGEPCLAPMMDDRLDHLPILDRENVGRVFLRIAHGNERIPELLAKLSLYLRGQSEHSRVVPLVAVALGIRSLYARTSMAEGEAPSPDRALLEEDAAMIIRNACSRVKAKMRHRYVVQKEVENDVFERYFDAIEKYLRARFDGAGDAGFSLEGCLERIDPTMTLEEYRRNHRARMEYLARKTTEQVQKSLRLEAARGIPGL